MSSPYIKWPLTTILLALSSFSFAEKWSENISTSGFIATGALHISPGDPEEKSTFDSIVEGGLNMSATLPKNVEINAQLLYREFGSLSDYSEMDVFNLDYLTLDWRFSINDGSEQGISIGRIKSNGGIYSNTRDIPFTRPSILLAQSVYTENFRSIYSHIDGIGFNSTLFTDHGNYSIEMGYGRNDLDDNYVSSFLLTDYANSISSDALYFIDLRYRNNNWMLVGSYHNVDAKFSGSISGDRFGFANINFDIAEDVDLENILLGVQYSNRDFEFTAEWVRQEATTPPITIFNQFSSGNLTYKLDGYYLQGRYFISPDIFVMARYEHLDPKVTFTPIMAEIINPNALVNSENIGMSFTWLINENWQIAADYHISKSMGLSTRFSLMEVSWRF